jgi:2,4-dichlorophenol 6-monooxygenase
VAWRNQEGTLDAGDAAEKLGRAICVVLDLPSLSTIPREKQSEPSKPSGTPLFA